MNKLLVILGPTATGKTDLAIFLAKKFNGELVACDSRQVYVGLDIGSGKLPSGRWKIEDGRWKKGKGFWEVGGIPIHMYDVVDPKIQYSVADYVRDGEKVISDITKRGKVPIIVGGTGLYLKALLEGLANLEVPVDKTLRKKLQKLSKEKLQEKLKRVSAEKWDNLNHSDRENPRRLVRAIELQISPRRSHFDFAQYHLRGVSQFSGDDILRIGLTAPREVLYKRVDDRVISRIKQGMIDEAKSLHKSGLSLKRMKELGLEYRVLARFLLGEIGEVGELIGVMQGKIHGYVRRQLTWFKRPTASFGSIEWFDITDEDFADGVENLVTKWYHKLHGAKN